MEDMLTEAEKSDIVWIGEVHGIRENYLAYKNILPSLFSLGYKNILWEMPNDFNEAAQNSEDGKISPYAIDFLRWIDEQKKQGLINTLNFIGQIYGFSDYEKALSDQIAGLLEKDRDKTIILTGNYHLKNSSTKSAQEYLAENSKFKILKVEFFYGGGEFYNHGLRNIKKNNKFEESAFMAVKKEGDVYFCNIGEVHAVFENPAAN